MPTIAQLPTLPISEVLADIRQELLDHNELILEAPPGAGKTTLVPLALLDTPWRGDQRILMLEPRRLAATAAARRLASLLGESVGNTVGYRVRQETRISDNTRIEVVTEGVLNRMLMDDPSLTGVALLIFDEFHERSLDADLGLALALQGRNLFREPHHPLKIVLMSATLNGESLSQLLPQAPLIRSEGKMFPVDIIYGKPYRFDDRIAARSADTILRALAENTGNLLAFLPGQREIIQTQRLLAARVAGDVAIRPLYGALSTQQQQLAIEPPAKGLRKIVLATDIAETSLTIEGVTVVVDSGLRRQPEFDLNNGMTRLHTRRISQDSSTQRCGRAGRLQPGRCYRLWSEEQQRHLEKFRVAEIRHADLAPLALQLIAWGVDDVEELDWLDPPPAAALQQALNLLRQLGAVDQRDNDGQETLGDWRLSDHGKLMAQLPTHPRIAHMLLVSDNWQLQHSACVIAALLSDRSSAPVQTGADLCHLQSIVSANNHRDKKLTHWIQTVRKQADQFRRIIHRHTPVANNPAHSQVLDIDRAYTTGLLLACAYPERIAQRIPASANEYRLANGQKALLSADDSLAAEPWIAIAELGGRQHSQAASPMLKIFSAAAFDASVFDNVLNKMVSRTNSISWDTTVDRFVAETRYSVGKLVLKTSAIETPSPDFITAAVLQQIKARGLALLPWTASDRQWQARVQLLYQLQQSAKLTTEPKSEGIPLWPDVSDQTLLDRLEDWLLPFIGNVRKLADIKKLDMTAILATLLPWPLPQHLEQQCPTTIAVPSGSHLQVDYLINPPVLRVKLQEMFGCIDTPTIANGRIQLMLHLLSPAQRPLQVTQDLAGFWQSSYFDIQKEMKGRYPKHPWPDNPQQAQATKYTKSKMP